VLSKFDGIIDNIAQILNDLAKLFLCAMNELLTDIDKDINDDKPHLDILFQDEYFVAVDKPAGLFVHRSYLDRHEKYFALQLVRDQVGQYVYPVHRLDRPTSGVLLFALTEEVARLMNEQFSSRQVNKTYYALTRGHLLGEGIVDHPLKEQHDKIADKFAQQNKEAQSAVTQYESVATATLPIAVGKYPSVRYSFVKLMPETGRKHQIRRHLSHLRYPIIGDINHGDNKQNPFFHQHFGFKRLMLQAKSLAFTHPITGNEIVIESRFDNQWQQVFTQLGWTIDS